MKIKKLNLLSCLALLLLCSTATAKPLVPNGITRKYDRFKNQTTLLLRPELPRSFDGSEKHFLRVKTSFKGETPTRPLTFTFGFIVFSKTGLSDQCVSAEINFLADNRIIKSQRSDTSSHGSNNRTLWYEGALYNFWDFYDREDLLTLAQAKTVEYQVCGIVHTMSDSQQQLLKTYLDYLNEL
ncbi:MAG: hypothetical protein GVY17_01600 [Cyanobacteria bacterium]|jgi:hypothetical protein|nr:hypothetical protein [Cyanobacteria bacterium GSL.Bin21]